MNRDPSSNPDRARQLRQNMTDTERFVWQRLRGRRFANYKFRRQVSIGPYIADFVCFSQRLTVELDGGQHTERRNYDEARTAWLESQGFRVLRFWNHEVLKDWEVVEEVIYRELQKEGNVAGSSPPHPALSREGRG